MKKDRKLSRNILAFVIISLIAIALMGCSKSKSSDVGEENQFTWWITRNDSAGIFYDQM